MAEGRRTMSALESDLEKVDDMLAGLADLHSNYRSTEEIRGGILAARDRIREMWRRVSATSRPERERGAPLA